MRPDDYPVCPDCGERHPPVDAEDLYDLAISSVILQAVTIVARNPGKFPELEAALQLGDLAAGKLMAEGKSPGKPSDSLRGPDDNPPERGIGFYI